MFTSPVSPSHPLAAFWLFFFVKTSNGPFSSSPRLRWISDTQAPHRGHSPNTTQTSPLGAPVRSGAETCNSLSPLSKGDLPLPHPPENYPEFPPTLRVPRAHSLFCPIGSGFAHYAVPSFFFLSQLQRRADFCLLSFSNGNRRLDLAVSS